jgi:protein-disulfide isomerase
MSSKEQIRGPVSKREEMRERRRKQERGQSIAIIAVVVVLALVVLGLLIAPSISSYIDSQKPVGEIVTPKANPRPNANGLSMGDPNAPVKVVIYSDFQCPACKNFVDSNEPTVITDDIKTGKVFYTYAPFSFIGPESFQAANAALCAADQNKFWEYHDYIFANQTGENTGDFSDRRLVAFAQQLGLDMTKFNTCFKANTHKQQYTDTYNKGVTDGVTATPSIFVNGVKADDPMKAIADAVAAVK